MNFGNLPTSGVGQQAYALVHEPYAMGGFETDMAHHIRTVRNNMAIDMPHGVVLAMDETNTGAPILATEKSRRLPTAYTDTLTGISVYSQAHAPGPLDSFGINGIRPYDALDEMDLGDVVSYGQILSGSLFDPTIPVFVRHAPSSAPTTPAAGVIRDLAHGAANPDDQNGILTTSADSLTAWTTSQTWTLGQRRAGKAAGASANYVYECTTAGAGASSGDGPVGTAAGETDNAAVWAYVGAGLHSLASCVAWTRLRVVSRTTASGLVTVRISAP